jgi:hypothetical protein
MELTAEQLEYIRQSSGKIEYGKITISFAGNLTNTVDIDVSERKRFHNEQPRPAASEASDRAGVWRY